MNDTRDDPIVRFYRGEGRDGAGRTIEEVWGFSAVRLELTHDFIQWLFPLRHPSAFNAGAATLTLCANLSRLRAPPGWPSDTVWQVTLLARPGLAP